MIQRLLLSGIVAMALVSQAIASDPTNALQFKMKTLQGEEVDLAKYEGKVVLMVNVASACGLTKQYKELQAMFEKYQDKGLVIIGFPCNQFGGQEPGSAEEIKKFCESKYNVTFDLMSKIEVNGDKACDLYKYLTSLDIQPKGKGKISWNFEKFLIDRKGNVVGRFDPRTEPNDEKLVSAIESALEAEVK
jgi:glutathione peroxidase